MRPTRTLCTAVASVAFTVAVGMGAGDVQGEFATVEGISVEVLSPDEMAAIEGKVNTDTLFLLAPSRSFFFTQMIQDNPVINFFPRIGGPLLQIDLSGLLNSPQPQRAIAFLGPAGLLDFPLGSVTSPFVLIGLNP